MHYYYDKNGQYMGCNNLGMKVQGSKGCTSKCPVRYGQVWDANINAWVDELPAASAPVSINAAYKAKVDGYSIRQVKSALRFAKSSAKIAILEARRAKLSA